MDIGIIGGGASGMILASKLKNLNVTILERNSKLGKKLSLTGNGKCNFTNKDFNNLDNIYNNEFAIQVYNKYNNESFINYFKKIGITAKFELHRGTTYVYPYSNKSSSVIYNLLDKIIENKVKIKYDICINEITKKDNKFVVKNSCNDLFYFDIVVLACGGNSYKNTGSDGTGYKIAKSLGHKIVEPLPALCALKYLDKDLNKIKGVRVDAIIHSKNISFIEKGEVQFTEFGVSGIPVFNLSRLISRNITNGNTEEIYLDFYTLDDDFELDNHFKKVFELLKERKKNLYYKKLKDFLCGFLPDEISEVILHRSCIKSKKIVDLSDDELLSITKNIVFFKINIKSCASFDNAQITIGGIDIKDVDRNTLESKKVKNLYFVGEILDIDGKCGGYNLQLAYSTASIVAESLWRLYGFKI